jgi:hypothetical protein
MVKVVDRVHAFVDRPGTLSPPWTDGGADRECQSAVVRSPEYGLRPLRCTKAHRRGRNRERGARGAWFGPHQSSGCEVDRRRCGQRVPECGAALTRGRPPAAPVDQSSPAGMQQGERSTGRLVRASPELGRRHGGRAMVVQNRRRRRPVRGRLERGEKRRGAGRGAVRGWCSPFIGVGGASGRGGQGG